MQMDLGDVSTIEEKVQEIFRVYETVDILVNNAGLTHRGSALETKIEVDQQIMNVNYFGTIALTKGVNKYT